MSRRRIGALFAATLVLPLLTVVGPASPLGANQAKTQQTLPSSDIRELTRKDFTLDGRPVQTPPSYQSKASGQGRVQAVETPPVGTVRQWLGLDDFFQRLYRKDYTLRGVGTNIEVWVANDLSFPAGDCRNQSPDATTVTDAQVADLIEQFDNNMYPKETQAFSRPPDRDGTNSILGPDGNGNGGVYTGAGNRTVTLVDNIREDNFYQFPEAATYIAGVFVPDFNELFDRNVMSIDAFDWAHRTGANPPDEPTEDVCTSRPSRPFLYESVFAHEWQHLAHYYADPFETVWVNEGLADFAQTLTGYTDGTRTIFDRGANSHLFCYQGFGTVQTPFHPNARPCGGPENSLNIWDEGTSANDVPADYGHAYQFLLFLFDRYGTALMSRLHQDGQRQGLASLKAALAAQGVHDLYRTIHEFQTMTLVDKIVGESPAGVILGVPKNKVTTASVRSTVNLDNPASYATPGAAPNGADYVALRNASGQLIKGRDLRSLSFRGAATLPPLPLAWTIVNNDPDRPGNAVLWSGNRNKLDSSAVAQVTVPTSDPTLRFLAKYGAEPGFDYGYVIVSTDGGATYTAIAGDKTVEGPLGPAVNGTTNGFEPHTYDLSAYAGQSVLLGLRYVSDVSINEGGLLVDDVTLGATPISDGSSLTGFKSITEIKATAVHNWNVRLVGIDEQRQLAWQFEFDGRTSFSVNQSQLALLSLFPKVVAIVAYDEPTEQVTQYAPYTLTVNGVVQPGGL
jgi:Immune inhibitor A peptidase M6